MVCSIVRMTMKIEAQHIWQIQVYEQLDTFLVDTSPEEMANTVDKILTNIDMFCYICLIFKLGTAQ